MERFTRWRLMVAVLAAMVVGGDALRAAPDRVTGPTCAPAGHAAAVAVHGGTAQDRVLVCAGLQRALSFFRELGLAPQGRIRIEFATIVNPPGATAVDLTGDIAAAQVAGLFDRVQSTVRMTSEASPWLRDFRYFGQPMSEEMITSILTHEIVHALSRGLYADALQFEGGDLHVQEEYVAYAAQLATMSTALRSSILLQFAPPRSGSTEGEDPDAGINALALALDPESFGVGCYRHFASEAGGAPFLRRLYSGAFLPANAY